MMNEQTLATYLPASHTPTSVMKIHFVMQQHGGGSKMDAHHRLKQQAIEFLLQCGANAADVNSFVHDLYEKAGMARFQHTMAIKDGEEKLAQIRRLAQAMHVKPIHFEDLQAERWEKDSLVASQAICGFHGHSCGTIHDCSNILRSWRW